MVTGVLSHGVLHHRLQADCPHSANLNDLLKKIKKVPRLEINFPIHEQVRQFSLISGPPPSLRARGRSHLGRVIHSEAGGG